MGRYNNQQTYFTGLSRFLKPVDAGTVLRGAAR
jgi:hypothetical protein